MKTRKSEFDVLVCEIQKHLRFLAAAGSRGLDLTEKSLDIIRSWERRDPSAGPAPPVSKSMGNGLSEVFEGFSTCNRCRLAENRKGSVFGEGPQQARVMFIGFMPEAGDAETGRPYTGNAGEMLTRIIEAMKLDRNRVYISHIVKCLPVDDRLPGRWEAKACRHHLVRQIQAVRPELICVLGESAARAFLGVDEPFSRVRGRFHAHEGIPVMPTYEPAHLLTHPSAKRHVWQDMQAVMKALDNLLKDDSLVKSRDQATL